jgi:stage V sporulation protein G
MSESSTATVNFVITGLERLNGAGRLIALATVEIDLEGVVILVQGIQVVRCGSRITAQAPRFRDPRTGTWTAAVILPEELGAAIAGELQKMLRPQTGEVALADVLSTPIEALIDEVLADAEAGDASSPIRAVR